jgi:LysM repeat protein
MMFNRPFWQYSLPSCRYEVAKRLKPYFCSMQRFGYTLLVVVLGWTGLFAQTSADYAAYIREYGALAMEEQVRTGIPAAIKMAQGLLESGAGKGSLVQRSNNHFGIKCKATWTGEKAYHDDDARGECFRAYSTPLESYKDHSDYLVTSNRYTSLFELDPRDYKGWANGLKRAGYATNPRYAQLLIKVIEDNRLHELTDLALQGNWETTDWAANFTYQGKNASASVMDEPVSKIAAVQVVPENAQLQHTVADTRITGYPTTPFAINQTKVVWAQAGTSMLALAAKHKVTLGELLAFNDMPRKIILDQDQLVFLERKKKAGAKEYRQALSGETLWSISQAEGVRLDLLVSWNKLAADQPLAEGTKVYLQEPAADKTGSPK